MNRILERVKEISGVYRLGFNPDSFMGLMLPIAFVVLVSAAGWLFNKLFL